MSAGLQIGGSSTDYVLLVMTKPGVTAVLQDKTSLGGQASVAAGPTGGTAGTDGGKDVLTYARSKGAFAGLSLGGANLSPDKDANERLYGKAVTPEDILMKGTVSATEGGRPIVALLNSKAPTSTR